MSCKGADDHLWKGDRPWPVSLVFYRTELRNAVLTHPTSWRSTRGSLPSQSTRSFVTAKASEIRKPAPAPRIINAR